MLDTTLVFVRRDQLILLDRRQTNFNYFKLGKTNCLIVGHNLHNYGKLGLYSVHRSLCSI